jgi:hypothetical protein
VFTGFSLVLLEATALREDRLEAAVAVARAAPLKVRNFLLLSLAFDKDIVASLLFSDKTYFSLCLK